jgi:hypothetical protein
MDSAAPLASAFLALSDGPVAGRSPARAGVALLVGLVVSLAGPLTWTVAVDGRPADQPIAAAVGKVPSFEPDEEDEA